MRLSELLSDGVSYGIVQPGQEVPDGTPILRIKDIHDGVVDTREPLRVSSSLAKRFSRTELRGGELLLTVVGTPGQTAIVPEVLAGWNVARAIAVLRPAGADPRWLHYVFQTPNLRNQIDSRLNTTVQATLNLDDVKKLEIPDTPLPEQQAIAEVLGALDDKIAANRALVNDLDDLSTMLYRRCTAGLHRISLSEVIKPTSGGTPKRDVKTYWDGDVPWISVRDVVTATAGAIIHASETISPEGSANSAAKMVPAGTVILTARGTVGEVARLTMDGTFNQSCYGFIPREIPSAVLFHLVRDGAQTARQVAHGSVFSTITTKTMTALEVPHLSQELMANLEVRLAPLHDRIDAACHESATLATLRDTLLPALMDGTLRVKEAEKVAEEVL